MEAQRPDRTPGRSRRSSSSPTSRSRRPCSPRRSTWTGGPSKASATGSRPGLEDRGSGLVLRNVAGGWRLYTHPDAAPIVEQFVLSSRQARLTKAALETLVDRRVQAAGHAAPGHRDPRRQLRRGPAGARRPRADRGGGPRGDARAPGPLRHHARSSWSGSACRRSPRCRRSRRSWGSTTSRRRRADEPVATLDADGRRDDLAESMPRTRRPRTRRRSESGPRPTTPPTDPMAEERLQRALARAGFGSRRACEELIVDGRVTVERHGRHARATRSTPRRDAVAVDGVTVNLDPNVRYYALHKPAGRRDHDERPAGTPGHPRLPAGGRPAGVPGRPPRPRHRRAPAAHERRRAGEPPDAPALRGREGVPGRGRGRADRPKQLARLRARAWSSRTARRAPKRRARRGRERAARRRPAGDDRGAQARGPAACSPRSDSRWPGWCGCGSAR